MLWKIPLIFVTFFVGNTFGYIEYVEVSNCESCQLMLTCRHLSSVIAVFNATFTPVDPNSVYYDDVRTIQLFPRLALNRRCSGVNHCSFVLNEDCPGAERWGAGNLSVHFACVAEQRMTRYCNENITLPASDVIGASEGFIRNPGYPNYYVGKEDCTWRIRAPALQQIKLTVLDLSLIGANDDPEGCNDVLDISEVDNTIFSSCNEQEPYAELLTLGDSVDVTLRASESLVARRGILLYYTAVGCATPSSPRDGYLVYRNDTAAVFTCCVGFVFADSGRRTKELQCVGHRWTTKLPFSDCIRQSHTYYSLDKPSAAGTMSEESLSDVLVPTIIIVMLFIINSIVLFFIYQYKKRKTALYTEEELGTMPVGSTN